MIKISVIIPIYNMELFIEECLDSVFSQSLKEIEVICIDDGSTDRTMQILYEYKDKHCNMQIISQNRQGAGSARNKGIKIAKGEFLAFMDSDDYYPTSDVLQSLYEVAKKNNVLMAGGNIFRVLESSTISREKEMCVCGENESIIQSKEYQNPYGYSRFIYDRNMILVNKIYFPDLVRHQDPPFMLDALIAAEKLLIMPKDVYAYREFDKKIEYTSQRVICDIVKGYLYMMKKSKEYNYTKLQYILINKINNNKLFLVFHICNNNDELYKLLIQIGNEIIDKNEREKFLCYWDKENTLKIYIEESKKLDKLDDKIQGFRKVIIYGAGIWGKAAYDYVTTINNTEFIGFAVTEENPNGTARGHVVQSLSKYLEHKEDSLVLITVKGEISNDMKKHAENLGFKNIMIVDYRIENIKANKITNGRFAFDN